MWQPRESHQGANRRRDATPSAWNAHSKDTAILVRWSCSGFSHRLARACRAGGGESRRQYRTIQWAEEQGKCAVWNEWCGGIWARFACQSCLLSTRRRYQESPTGTYLQRPPDIRKPCRHECGRRGKLRNHQQRPHCAGGRDRTTQGIRTWPSTTSATGCTRQSSIL